MSDEPFTKKVKPSLCDVCKLRDVSTSCRLCSRTFCDTCIGGHPIVTCDHCGKVETCADTLHQGETNDETGHACCKASLKTCRYCSIQYCVGHRAPNDSAPLSTCPHCLASFCDRHQAADHMAFWDKDAEGHQCCPSSLGKCAHCGGVFCKAHTKHDDKVKGGCGDDTCSAAMACALCNKTYCRKCEGVKTRRDLCHDCLVKSRKDEKLEADFLSTHERIPGLPKERRTVAADGSVKCSGSAGRDTPPPPLCSGQTEANADIEELKQFDRGHLIALENGGKDNVHLIAPMIRQFNQSGKWRQMEINLNALMKSDSSLYDVDGGELKGKDLMKAAKALTLRDAMTLNNTKWHFEARLFYEDTKGDSRVPVWFYVRLLYNKKVAAHFSFANRCGKLKTLPEEEDSIEFQAARDLYAKLDIEEIKKLLPDGLTDDYDVPDSKKRPNQLLQFMRDVNQQCLVNGVARVFEKMEVETQSKSTPYTDFQRSILRKFNRWRNKGDLLSDVQEGDVFDGEKKDVHSRLDECGGRTAPEVDHISPSYQGGANTYVNARLVSFQHNHLYREKKTRGSKSLDEQLKAMFKSEQLAFIDKANFVYERKNTVFKLDSKFLPSTVKVQIISPEVVGLETGKVADAVATYLKQKFADDVGFDKDDNYNLQVSKNYTPYLAVKNVNGNDMIDDRQTFLRAEAARQVKYDKEEALTQKYTHSMTALAVGLKEFIDNKDHPERVSLLKLIAETGLKLCRGSDLLKDNGGELAVVADGIFVDVSANDARKDDAYIKLMKRWDTFVKS